MSAPDETAARTEARDATVARLFSAIAEGDAEVVAELLGRDASLANADARGQWGNRSALHAAAVAGSALIVDSLLRAGANVHVRDQGDNATPLHWAAGENHLEAAARLLDSGADAADMQDVHEGGPLGWATIFDHCHTAMADLLMSRGAQANIFAAIALNRADRVRDLVAADPTVLSARMSRFEDHRQPLHFAVHKDRREMVELLLDLGADLNAETPSFRTPLCVAMESKREELAELLRARGAAVDLMAAIAIGDEGRAAELLAAPVEAERLNLTLLAAAHHGRVTTVPRLLELGANPNTKGRGSWLSGTSPLILAADGNHGEVGRLLMEAGADVAYQDEYPGATALHFASWNGNQELGALLLERGADIHRRDRMFDADPLGWAIENRQEAMVDFLVERGADLDLARAAFLGRLELVRSLLEADPSAIDSHKGYGSALHQAALHGRAEIVTLLLERGASPAALNLYGDTVLAAVRKARIGKLRPSNLSAHAEIEKLLLEAGATG